MKILAKSLLIPLRLTAAASAADAGIHKKKLVSGRRPSSSASHNNNNNFTILIISSDEMKVVIKTVKSLEDSSLLPERVSKTIKNEVKEQKGGFLSMKLGTLGASLLGNILTGKGINRDREGIDRAAYGDKKGPKKKIDF